MPAKKKTKTRAKKKPKTWERKLLEELFQSARLDEESRTLKESEFKKLATNKLKNIISEYRFGGPASTRGLGAKFAFRSRRRCISEGVSERLAEGHLYQGGKNANDCLFSAPRKE